MKCIFTETRIETRGGHDDQYAIEPINQKNSRAAFVVGSRGNEFNVFPLTPIVKAK